MTHEEMLDFDIIECGDAKAAKMLQPQIGRLTGLPGGMTELEANQRGLMIEGLAARARRQQLAMERFRRYEAAETSLTTKAVHDALDQLKPGWDQTKQ
jgi:hypothetical protein